MTPRKYSTRLRLVLYLPLNTPPRAVFPGHTRGSALTHMCGTPVVGMGNQIY